MGYHALSNPKEFKVQEAFENYNVEGSGFVPIKQRVIQEIINCKNISVVWLVKESPDYVYQGVTKKSFKLREFRSILLKLKIIDWYDYLIQNRINPKLYFAIDKPISNKETAINLEGFSEMVRD